MTGGRAVGLSFNKGKVTMWAYIQKGININTHLALASVVVPLLMELVCVWGCRAGCNDLSFHAATHSVIHMHTCRNPISNLVTSSAEVHLGKSVLSYIPSMDTTFPVYIMF